MGSTPAKLAPLYLLLAFLLLGSSINFIEASDSYLEAQESNRVIHLPGQPSTPSISQFSGYITVNKDHGRALFYWFFEAQSQPSNKPLVLWLNGGPGCSSIGYGAAVELGPLRVNENGTGLHFNKYAWNRETNLLFLESPIGVGFSYSNTSSDMNKLDDGFVAEDAYNFLVNWLQSYPQFKTRDFFLAGESYAGHYVPQLAELVFDRNRERSKYPLINLKGFIVGNPETDDYCDSNGLLEYAWSHTVISDELYNKAKKVCDFNLLNWSEQCNEVMSILFKKYREIDIYNIYAPSCLTKTTGSAVANTRRDHNVESVAKVSDSRLWRLRIPGGYDPCYSTYAVEYFNRRDVQSSLHANIKGGKWTVCNNAILWTYNYTVFSVLPIYTKLIKGGLKIWIYSGDTDGRVPVIGSRYWVEALRLPLKSYWRSWFHRNQVGGRMAEYEGLSMVTVRGAGHLVPLNKPSEALALFHSFLTGEQLPDHPSPL